MHLRTSVILATCLLALVTGAHATSQDRSSDSGRQEFTATALSPGGPRTTPVAGRLDITIERWSTEAEQKRFVEALRNGQDAMLETLRDLSAVGRVRTPTSLGWDLHYSHQQPGEDGGRRIFSPPIGPSASGGHSSTAALRLPVYVIELRLSVQGEGEGKLSRATRVITSDDGRFVQLENYAAQPVALNRGAAPPLRPFYVLAEADL